MTSSYNSPPSNLRALRDRLTQSARREGVVFGRLRPVGDGEPFVYPVSLRACLICFFNSSLHRREVSDAHVVCGADRAPA